MKIEIEKEEELEDCYGMAEVGEPKKYVPNKVVETDINNVVEIK